MTQGQNLQVVGRFFDARNDRDLDALVGCLDPDVEFDLSESRSPYRGVYRGTDQVRRGLQDVFEAWGEFEMKLTDPIEIDDDVVVSVLVDVSGQSSGIRWQGEGANVFTVKRGKIVRFRLYQTRAEALEAAGLSE